MNPSLDPADRDDYPDEPGKRSELYRTKTFEVLYRELQSKKECLPSEREKKIWEPPDVAEVERSNSQNLNDVSKENVQKCQFAIAKKIFESNSPRFTETTLVFIKKRH